MYPPGVGLGGSGTPAGVSLVVSLLVVVEEGPRNAGGALVLQANVVVLGVEEMTLSWVETVELGIGVGLWGGRFISVAAVAAGAEGELGRRVLGALWVLGVAVLRVAGAGLAVPPGAGGFTDPSGVLVLRVVTAGLVTTLVLVVAPCVRAGGGTELGEVALGLTAARTVVRRVTAGGVALFEVADWWMKHGTTEPVVRAGRAVEVAAGLTAAVGAAV